jgi:glutamate synthase (NADPH/NADH) small chain
MGKISGFLDYQRKNPDKRPVAQRIHDFDEFEQLLSESEIRQQAARCMDCGVPFCHAYGCPLKNRIPDWNDMVYHGHWKRALNLLHSTNNFPEITGRICPELCEASCTLAINQSAVTARHIELQIIERGFSAGWIQPEKTAQKTGYRVAIIGSGPAGLAAAQQLVRRGHEIVVFEQADRIGGLLRYGIPDFKLKKSIIDRRLHQMTNVGVIF